MPIYEYQCNACEHRLEVLQKISDDPLKNCPVCNQDELRKLMSATSFRLKGTGWYETDFKNKSSDKETDKAKSNSTEKPTTSDTKTSSDSSTGKKAASNSD